MPKYEHDNFGDVQDHIFAKGIITSIDRGNDLADVTVEGYQSGEAVPLYYHCEPDSALRGNGAIEGAADAFNVDDEVMVMLQVDGPPVRIIGLVDGIKPCRAVTIMISCMLDCVIWNFGTDDYSTEVTWNSCEDPDSEDCIDPLHPDHNGGPVLESDWPVDMRFISQWIEERGLDPDAKVLFGSDWDVDPPKSTIWTWDDDSSSGDSGDGSGIRIFNNYAYFNWACYPWWDTSFLGKHDTIIQCDGRIIHPNQRKWSFLGEHTSLHEVDNHTYKKMTQGALPWQPLWWQTIEEWNSNNLLYDTWSGQKYVAANGSQEVLRFYRHLTEEDHAYSQCDQAYPIYSFCRVHSHTASYTSEAGYQIPNIGGGPVFEIENVLEFEEAEWTCDWVSTHDAWDDDWNCGGRPPSQWPGFQSAMGMCPLAHLDAIKSAIACDGAQYLDDPMMKGTGLYNVEKDWMIAAFGRIKSEDWSGRDSHNGGCEEMFQYEVFIGWQQGEGGDVAEKAPSSVLQKHSRLCKICEDMMAGHPPRDISAVLPPIYPDLTAFK